MNNQNGQLSAHEQFNQAAQAGRMDKQVMDAVLAHHADPTPDTRRAIEALIARLENNTPVQASAWQPTLDELSALPPDEIARKLKKILLHPQPVPLATLGPAGEASVAHSQLATARTRRYVDRRRRPRQIISCPAAGRSHHYRRRLLANPKPHHKASNAGR